MRPDDDKTIKMWPAVVAAIFIVLVLLTFQRSVRMVPKASPDFLTAAASAGARQDQALADHYWSVAVNTIQWKYARGIALPDKPPAEFSLAAAGEPGTESPAVRAAYWNALRRVWLQPGSWRTTVEVDLGWPQRAVRSVLHDIEGLMN